MPKVNLGHTLFGYTITLANSIKPLVIHVDDYLPAFCNSILSPVCVVDLIYTSRVIVL
jgi:hypothetical protein